MDLAAKTGPEEVTLEAVVIRADGSREDLGALAYWHKRWWRRALWRLRHG